MGLFALACLAVEPAETEVAMCDERAHLELGGQGHGGAIVRFGRPHVWAGPMGGNLGEEPESPRLIAPFTALTGERHGTVGAGTRLPDPVREQVCFAKLSDANRVAPSDTRRIRMLSRPAAARRRPPRGVLTRHTRAREVP